MSHVAQAAAELLTRADALRLRASQEEAYAVMRQNRPPQPPSISTCLKAGETVPEAPFGSEIVQKLQ